MKRTDYISWDDYFMGISLLSGMRSKDPSTQVGACIVDKDNRIVSIGYNGFLNGCIWSGGLMFCPPDHHYTLLYSVYLL